MRGARARLAAVVAFVALAFGLPPALPGEPPTVAAPSAELTDFASPAEAAALDRQIAHDVAEVSAARLRTALAELTAKPHFAGSPRGREVAAWIAGQFRAAGLAAAVDGYRALVSTPRRLELALVAPEAVELDLAEPPSALDPQVGRGTYLPFNAYSGSGEVTAELVYVGGGRQDDYAELARRGISVKGRIVVARYGGLFRGTKVKLAEEQGAAAVILFTDPAGDGEPLGPTWPAGPWRPEWSVQRGSVWAATRGGDAATPGFPSPPAVAEPPFASDPLPLAARATDRTPLSASAAAALLPRIPVLPVSAANAARLLATLGGPEAPEAWRGALPIGYHLGPGPTRARLAVEMDLAEADLWNAIGWLPGSTDELLLVGAHHDAWDFGAVDSGSGVVATIEAARVLGAAARGGWRPRRTVIFTAWDGEELSLIGSSEFAERFAPDLQRRAVAVVNLDGAVGGAGGAISAAAAPQLAAWIELAAARVPDPLEPGSLRDAWLRQQEPPPSDGRPQVWFLGASSDHAAFAVLLGLPAGGMGIGEDFGPYHSTLDDFQWVARLGDPSFLWHRTLTQWLVAALEIAAGTERLPLVIADYGARLEQDLAAQVEAVRRTGDAHLGDALAAARRAAAEWRIAAAVFDRRGRHALGTGETRALARWNELARTVDRRFLIAAGLQGQPGPRHLLVAPGERTGTGRALMPTLAEDLQLGDRDGARDLLTLLEKMLHEQTAALAEP